MKSKKLLFLEKILRWIAIRILEKYQPKIVAVTGSVGKTTTKEMIAAVLGARFFVRKSQLNYNNEVGVPLTIIGAKAGGHSPFRWAAVFWQGASLLLFKKKYPQILILELGADRPGDLKYLCSFLPIDVGVLTNVGISHLEYFKTKKEVAKEKGILLQSLPASGLAVYNYDNEDCRKAGQKAKANAISYGFEESAKIKASDIYFGYEEFLDGQKRPIRLLKGISFKLNYEGKIIPVRLNYCLGKPQIYAVLAALAVGFYFDINLLEATKALENFHPYPGRMSLVAGIKNTMIIDDSYNSAPDSLAAALDAFCNIQAQRKIVALGDMLELGAESQESHRFAGKLVAQSGAAYFIAVGKRMHEAALEFSHIVRQPEAVVEFGSPMEAGRFLQQLLKEGDLLLVKGSQGMRMEKIVEEVMAEPERKEALLVRQDKKWQKIGYLQP